MDMLNTFQRQRTRLLAGNICYFAALLAAGGFLAVTRGWPAVAAAVACVAAYLFWLRPAGKRYARRVVDYVLEQDIGQKLNGYQNGPDSKLDAAYIRNSGIFEERTSKAYRSWGVISGTAGDMRLSLSDVSFAILRKGYYDMFSGCCIVVQTNGYTVSGVLAREGVPTEAELPSAARSQLEKICQMDKGRASLSVHGQNLAVLLERRFLSFKAGPLLPITEQTLAACVLPELEPIIRLATLLS